MQIEQNQPSQTPMKELIKDSANRTKLIKMIYQSLKAMGWQKSAEQLREQSQINFDEGRVARIQSHFNNYQYSQAAQQISKLDISLQDKSRCLQTIQQLQILMLIKNGKIDLAIEQITNSSFADQQKKINFFSIIGLGFQDCDRVEFDNKHIEILQICSKNIKQKELFQIMLNQYLKEDKFAKKKITILNPPKMIVAQSSTISLISGKVSFIKFNNTANRIAMISEITRQIQISVWGIQDKIVTKTKSIKKQATGSIQSMKWSTFTSSDEGQQLIGICSFDRILILTSIDLRQVVSINRRIHQIPRFLCFDWQPISELIFVGGLFDSIHGFDNKGQLTTSFLPFMKARQIIFTNEGDLLAISATKGLLMKYNVQTQKPICQFTSNSSFMDMKYIPSNKLVIVSNKQHIYLLSSYNLSVLNTYNAPQNDKQFKIQSFYCNEWMIMFNEHLQGTIQNDKVSRHYNWPICEAVDLKNDRMVTFKSKICIWQNKQNGKNKVQLWDQIQDEQYSILNLCNNSSSQFQFDNHNMVPLNQSPLDMMEMEVDIDFIQGENDNYVYQDMENYDSEQS